MVVSCLEQTGMLPLAKSVIYDLDSLFTPSGDWSLPGHGLAYDDCGKLRFRGCPDSHSHSGFGLHNKVHLEGYYRRCNRKECPICYESWAGLEASKVAYRMLRYYFSKSRVDRAYLDSDDLQRVRKLENMFSLLKQKCIHVVLSVPQKDYYVDFKKNRSKAYKIALDVGIRCGITIYHPWREICSFCGSHKDTESKRCEKCGSGSFRWIFSPHFHALVFGWVDGSKVAENFNNNGWIVANLGVRNTVIGTIMYQLSHAGVNVKTHVVTWFGSMSYSKLKAKVPRLPKPVCPYCGAELVPMVFIGSEDKPPPCMPCKFLDDPKNWLIVERDSY